MPTKEEIENAKFLKDTLVQISKRRGDVSWLISRLETRRSYSTADSYRKLLSSETTFEGRIIAAIVRENSETFHADIANRILRGDFNSKKQTAALAYEFSRMELSFGEAKNAINKLYGGDQFLKKNIVPNYAGLATKRQVMLERLKSGQVRDFAKVIKSLEKLIRSTILALEEDIGTMSRTKLNKLLSDLRADQAAVFKAGTTALTTNLADISALYAAQEVADLQRTVDLRGTKLDSFTKKEVFAKVIKRPLTTDGQLLEPWIKNFSDREVARVNNTIRAGWSQGKTNQQLVQEIIGTKARNYKDGILQTTRRNASTVVRTSVQHAASAARQETWEANRDVVDKYEFLATLDRITSTQCRALDGQVFEFGKGPIPPIHPNCRSTTIPVLDEKYSFLSTGRTRSGETGPVSANQSYYDWLKKQPASVQTEVLGPTRAKLFKDGGMSAERFRELQFDRNFEPLTLDEMRALEPEAFKAAGI